MLRKIGFLAVFLITACLSFFVVKTIKESQDENSSETSLTTFVEPEPEPEPEPKSESKAELEPTPSPTPNVGEEEKKVEPDPSVIVQSQPDPSVPPAPKVTINATSPAENDNVYSFTASVTGEPAESYHYELWAGKNKVQSSNDGKFSDIPPVEGGKYFLHLVSEETSKDIVSPIIVKGFIDKTAPDPSQKRLISKEDFQKRMLDYNDHTLDGSKNKKKTFVTDGFRVLAVNVDKEKDGDFEINDVQDVRDMIRTYKKWSSAQVVELEYDPKGYVTLAKVEPVY